MDFGFAESNPDFPSGCYAFGRIVYFNNATIGRRQWQSIPICRDIGKRAIRSVDILFVNKCLSYRQDMSIDNLNVYYIIRILD